MRPINLTIVHLWPGIGSILNVMRFVSATRGPLQKPWNNLGSELEICPSLGNCSDPGEKSVALLQRLISRLFLKSFKRGRIRFAPSEGRSLQNRLANGF